MFRHHYTPDYNKTDHHRESGHLAGDAEFAGVENAGVEME